MVPQYFVFLDKMPLLPNGKINKQALPAPETKAEVEYVAPEDEVEARLVELWSEVLGMEQEQIGTHHNFFELGGHSLKATELVAKVFKQFHVELTIRQIFITPTIAELARCIKGMEKSVYASIEPAKEQAYYPVSSAQKRVFIIDQLKLAKTAYNMPGAVRIEGELDVARLQEAFQALILRHESLRTSFELVDGEPMQRVHPKVDFTMEYWTANPEELDTASLVNEFVRPFMLGQAPLFRIGLIRLPVNPETGQTQHVLLYDMHHIISDGVSMSIFVNEVIDLYKGEVIPELRIQYKDFAVWQHAFFQSDQFKVQEEYWLSEFADEIPILDMPTDYPRPAVMTLDGDRITFVVEEELTQRLYNLAQKHDATLYMVLLAVYNIFLSKYAGQEDIIVGTPIAGRPHPDLEHIMGMFVNTLAMRNYPVSTQTFAAFLTQVAERALKAYENQAYQFEMLVEKLALGWDISRNPLFTVMFALQNMGTFHVQLEDLTFSSYPMDYKNTKFDLTLTAIEGNHKIYFTLEYNTKLFKRTTVERMVKHFRNILSAVTIYPERTLAQVDMISAEERQQLLDLNDTHVDQIDSRVHQLFEAQVERTPDQIALVLGDEQLTYRQLNEKANQLARVLRARGVGRDTIVALMLDTSFAMIIAILGTLKAGGAYLPIDPTYPEHRIRYIFDDSQAKLLVTRNEFLANIQFTGDWIDLNDQAIWQKEVSNLASINEPDDLAYVIYTSGSTGQPKGVMIEHRGFTNTIVWRKEAYGLGIEDVSLQLFSYAFDGFVITFFTPIVSGATVILLRADEVRDPFAIKKHVIAHRVTYFMCVPTLYAAILDGLRGTTLNTLRCVTLGADQVTQNLVERSRQILPAAELVNEYGPTENSVVTTMQRHLEQESKVTIGRPVANNQVFILDKNDQLVPSGVPGELCIAGVGLARGYLHNPELTAEKFTVNPFNPQERMYRTGDKVRWTEDGKIEFLGRIDHQVKIRGFRIELGEIENQLMRVEGIKEAVVVARVLADGESHLCAYYVADEALAVGDVKAKLMTRVPDYMVPTHYIQMERLPLNANGKVNRQALPDVSEKAVQKAAYVAPTNVMEEKLAKIWSEILNIDQIGIQDNFFELGGHSLKATQLVTRIYQEFDVEMSLSAFFQNPTIQGLAEELRQSSRSEWGIKDENLLLLRRGTSPMMHLFMIHNGSGEVDAYLKFAAGVSPEFNFWGIRMDRLQEYAPLNISIEDLAEEYVEKIKKLQPVGPYYIAGWCVGGTVAFEIVKRLEKMGDVIKFCGIVNAMAPEKGIWGRIEDFSTQSEWKMLNRFDLDKRFVKRLKKADSIAEIWPAVIAHLEEGGVEFTQFIKRFPEGSLKAIPDYGKQDFKGLIYYHNATRVLSRARALYIPDGKIQTQMHFFQASETRMPNQERWDLYCVQPMKIRLVQGDHYSIFSNLEHVKALVVAFNQILTTLNTK